MGEGSKFILHAVHFILKPIYLLKSPSKYYSLHGKRKKALAPLLLSLWWRYFFHVYPGYWPPACASISRFVTSTITDPESHANSALVDFLTDSFDVTHTVQILFPAASMYHVDYSVNGSRCWTLCTIESEIPSSAACMAVSETKIATPKYTQPSSVWCFLETALLEN